MNFRPGSALLHSLSLRFPLPIVSGSFTDSERGAGRHRGVSRARIGRSGRSACLAVQFQPSPRFLARIAGGAHSSDSMVARREGAFPGESSRRERRRVILHAGEGIDDGDAAGLEAVLQTFREEDWHPEPEAAEEGSPMPAIPCPRPPQSACSSSPTTFGNPPSEKATPDTACPPTSPNPYTLEELLRADGPQAPSTVRRLRVGRPCIAETDRSPPLIRSALWLAVRAAGGHAAEERAVTRDILNRLVATCDSDHLVDTRDLAILGVALASGDRRRSEVARLRFEQLQDESAVPVDPADTDSTPLPCLVICLGRTKMTSADDEAKVFLVGAPVAVLKEWLQRADIPKGPIFRAADRWGAVGDRALTPQSINLILKRRCAAAGSTRLTSRRKAGGPNAARFWRRSLADASSRAKSGLESLPRRSDGARHRPCGPIRPHSLTNLTSTNGGKALALIGPVSVILWMVRGGGSASNGAGNPSTGSEMSCPRTTELRGCDWRERRARGSAASGPIGGGRGEDGTYLR